MRNKLAMATVGALTLAFAQTPAMATLNDNGDDHQGAEMTRGERELADMLGGRVAGEAENCIRQSGFNNSVRVIEDTALVFRQGRTLWVNMTRNPRSIDEHDVLVFRRFGSNLCSSDQVTTVDRSLHFTTGFVLLDEFVPYRMADDS